MTDTKFLDEFSKEIWTSTYKDHNDDTVDDTFHRVADYVAKAEKTPELKTLWADKFYDAMTDFKMTAGGRIYSNAGTEWAEKGTGLLNCYVAPRKNKDIDSLNNIIHNVLNQSNTLKSEGGWGENFSYIRPRGSFIHGVGVETPGSVKYMEIFDKTSDVITSGSGKVSTNKKAKGKIRKGAMMGVLDVWHPDIFEFITAKQNAGRLTKFNMSVNCTNDFMDRVIKIKSGDTNPELDVWELKFPDTTYKHYKNKWDGNLALWESWGYPVEVHETSSVMKIWNIIMESTYNRAEPGILWLDRANEFNPAYYIEHIKATNPSMPKGTLVSTKDGIYPINELENTTFQVKNLDGKFSDAKCFFSGKNKEILSIDFGGNKIIKSTKEHRFPVYDNGTIIKKYANDLDIGDMIPLNLNEDIGMFGDVSLTKDEGFLLGVYFGDGWISKRKTGKDKDKYVMGFSFNKEDKSFADLVLKLFNNQFNANCTLQEKDAEYTFCSSKNKTIQQYIQKYNLDVSKEKLPSIIWKSNDNFIKGFVDGLISTDGSLTFTKKTKKMTFKTSKHDVAYEFAKLLSFSGIKCNIQHTETKNIKFPNGKNYNKVYYSFAVSLAIPSVKKFANVYNITYNKKGLLLDKFVNYKLKKQQLKSNFNVIKNISLDEIKQDVWDISVYDDQHVFPCEWGFTGNCGEQHLAEAGVCDLASMNLTQFIIINEDDAIDFDFDKFKKYIPIAVRFLDNVNTVSNSPLPEYKESMEYKRRVGIGVLGWGSLLFMMKLRFAGSEANNLRDEIMKTLATECYKSSIDLAVEKGMFKYCDPIKHAEGKFVKGLYLSDEYMTKLRTTGIRNSSLLSCQPTGNTSIFANIPSGGIEPIFMPEYIRTVIVNELPESFADVCPKWFEGEWKETDMFKFDKEGDEDILRGEYDGITYKIDKNRGLTKEVLCEDYGVRWLKSRGEWEPDADYVVTTTELTADDHVSDLKGFARWVDSALSKTINLPNDYSFDDFENVYLDTYKSGYIKGITTYRAGTMTSVLSSNEDTEEEEIILDHVKMPDSSPATIKTIKAEGKKWYLTIVYHESDTRPFALFVKTNSNEKTINAVNAIDVLTRLAHDKGIPEEHIQGTLIKIDQDINSSKITRIISLLLRHGVLIKNIVLALDTIEDVFVGSFLFQIKKFLASYIKDGEKVDGAKCDACGSSKIEFSEGCFKCTQCGSSKCG